MNYLLAVKQINREILSGKHAWAIIPCQHRIVGSGVFARIGTHKVSPERFKELVLSRAIWN